MRYILAAVKDNAVNAFQPVISVRAEGEAMRGFMDAINDPNNKQLHQHPEDFDLYVIGYFDDETGRLEALDQPKQLTRGLSVSTRNQGR